MFKPKHIDSFSVRWVLILIIINALAINIRCYSLPYKVISFDEIKYNAASQNWSVCTGKNGMAYFANHNGLLEFDGITWKLHRSSDQSITRAVYISGDSIIYTSGYMEFGYWKPDKYGILKYYSLVNKAEPLAKNIEFWNIEEIDNSIYFQSFTEIKAFKNDTVLRVNLPGAPSVMNKVNNKMLVAVRDLGIYQINNDKPEPYYLNSFFKGKLVRFMIPYSNNQVMIGTAHNGIYLCDGSHLTEWKPEWTNYFAENEVNRAYYSKDGELVIGTILNGVAIFSLNNDPVIFNTENGLLNNTVLGINIDDWGNIWLALDYGISFISNNNIKSFSIENIPGIGAVYSAAVFNNKLYLGTNQGLFVKPYMANNKNIGLVPGTQGQIWDCRIIDGKLWAGHNQGTFLIDGDNMTKVSEQSGGFDIEKDIKNNVLLQSTYSSLIKYSKQGDTYTPRTIGGFFDLIRYIEIDYLDNLWASHMHLGIFKIKTNDSKNKVTSVDYFGEKTFGKEHGVHVFKVENQIIFTTGDSLFTYDDLNDTIISYTLLNKQLGEYAKSHRIIEAPNHYYWFISNENIGLIHFNEKKVNIVKEYPNSLFKSPALVDGFENIFPVSEKKALLCLQNGIAHLNASIPDTVFIIDQFKPVLREFEIYNNRSRTELLALNSHEVKIKHNHHNTHFRFSFPYYSNLPLNYKYFLEGLNVDWSENIGTPDFRFERLPKGKYNLKVKAVDLWGNESQTTEIHFIIKAPWYTSVVAYFLYLLIFIVFLLGLRSWEIQRSQKKEQHIKEEREKEVIRLRNEKLGNEVMHKSKELANSTMSIIKKNEFLLDLKKVISKQKEELGSRYPDKYYNYLNNKIDNNISNEDDWQVFETNFERAHEQFLKKIKDTYPDLTSNDLRLCAYLRMNLSSKEIAPLLGISVRGVENHRYRLRKKMGLEHDEILADIILSI